MNESAPGAKPGGSGAADSAGPDAPADVSPFVGLSVRQGKAIDALLQGVPIVRAAQVAGIHERTLRKWLRRHRFRLALLDARREAFAQAAGLTQKFAPGAIGTLVKIMNDPSAGASARVMAATALLRSGRESLELDDLGVRVEQLEELASTLPAQRKFTESLVREDQS